MEILGEKVFLPLRKPLTCIGILYIAGASRSGGGESNSKHSFAKAVSLYQKEIPHSLVIQMIALANED